MLSWSVIDTIGASPSVLVIWETSDARTASGATGGCHQPLAKSTASPCRRRYAYISRRAMGATTGMRARYGGTTVITSLEKFVCA